MKFDIYKKLLVLLLLLSLNSLTLTGCWDRKELNEIGIVVAIAVDPDGNNGIRVSSQIIRPSALEKKGGSSNEAPFEIVITSGPTMFQAIRNTIKEFDRRSIFPHVKVIIMNEELAYKGLGKITDFLTRSQELRKTAYLMIAKGQKAGDFLNLKHGLEKIQANYMEGIISRQSINADVISSTILDFIKKMPGEGIHPVLGVFREISVEGLSPEGKPESKKALALKGAAAFKKDKLVGFLNEEETFGYNLIIGKKNRATLNIKAPGKKVEDISLEMKKFKSKIIPSIKNRKMSFLVEIRAEANITEVMDKIDITNQEDFIKLNSVFGNTVYTIVDKAMKKIQNDLQTDIIGLGNAFYRKYPKDWKSVKNQWDIIFPEVGYKIKVSASLKGTGLLLKPLTAKEKKNK